MTDIVVSEMFYSLQGEGVHAGTPAVFLRLAGCNLVCGGRANLRRDKEDMEPLDDATWVCDTIDVWRSGDKYTPEELLTEWRQAGWLRHLDGEAHLIVTGGEPTIKRNQEAFIELYDELVNEWGINPYIEVETNGTIVPRREYFDRVNHFNISLKLANSGMPEDERINDEAIEFYTLIHQATQTGAKYKFVVSRWKDVREISMLIDEYDIPRSMISLMPAGQTQEQLQKSYRTVAQICRDWNVDFSPRLHIDIWDQATGV